MTEQPPRGPDDDDTNVTTLSGDKDAADRARRALAHYFDGDAAKIAGALEAYDGTYPDFETYVRRELEEHIAPYMLWLLDKWTDLAGVANDWLVRGRNWLLADGDDAVHVFLSNRPMAEIDEREIDVEQDQGDEARGSTRCADSEID